MYHLFWIFLSTTILDYVFLWGVHGSYWCFTQEPFLVRLSHANLWLSSEIQGHPDQETTSEWDLEIMNFSCSLRSIYRSECCHSFPSFSSKFPQVIIPTTSWRTYFQMWYTSPGLWPLLGENSANNLMGSDKSLASSLSLGQIWSVTLAPSST